MRRFSFFRCRSNLAGHRHRWKMYLKATACFILLRKHLNYVLFVHYRSRTSCCELYFSYSSCKHRSPLQSNPTIRILPISALTQLERLVSDSDDSRWRANTPHFCGDPSGLGSSLSFSMLDEERNIGSPRRTASKSEPSLAARFFTARHVQRHSSVGTR